MNDNIKKWDIERFSNYIIKTDYWDRLTEAEQKKDWFTAIENILVEVLTNESNKNRLVEFRMVVKDKCYHWYGVNKELYRNYRDITNIISTYLNAEKDKNVKVYYDKTCSYIMKRVLVNGMKTPSIYNDFAYTVEDKKVGLEDKIKNGMVCVRDTRNYDDTLKPSKNREVITMEEALRLLPKYSFNLGWYMLKYDTTIKENGQEVEILVFDQLASTDTMQSTTYLLEDEFGNEFLMSAECEWSDYLKVFEEKKTCLEPYLKIGKIMNVARLEGYSTKPFIIANKDDSIFCNGKVQKVIENEEFTWKYNKKNISAKGGAKELFKNFKGNLIMDYAEEWLETFLNYMEENGIVIS